MPRRSLYFTGPETVEVRERPVPDPGVDQVRVRTTASAISPGTELLVYRGDVPPDFPVDATIEALSEPFSYPLRYGYAAVGEVTAVGDGVDASWLGETVFAFHPHESHFLADPADLQRVPDGCNPAAATLLPTVETALNLVMDGRPLVGERVLVFGQGLVGLTTTALLSQFPLSSLVAVDTVAARRDLATAYGADAALAPTSARERFDPGDNVDDPAGADLVFEVSGNPDALDDAVAVTGFDGRVVVGSWYGTKPTTLDLGGRFHRSRIRLVSSQVSTLDPSLRGRWTHERRLALAWETLGGLDTDGLLTRRVDVGDAADAYRALDSSPGETVGILFTYGS